MKLESNKYIVEIKENNSYFQSKNGMIEGMLVLDGREVIDYDGVAELPKEVLELLENNNYDCAKHYDQYHDVYIKLYWELREAKITRQSKFLEYIYMMQGAMIDNGSNTLKQKHWEKMAGELILDVFAKQ